MSFLGSYKTEIGSSLKQIESQGLEGKGPKKKKKSGTKTEDQVHFEWHIITNTEQDKQWKSVEKSEVTPS